MRYQKDPPGEGIVRTTDRIEGWHRGLQAYFSRSTPKIWMLLEEFSEIQILNILKKLLDYSAPSVPVTKKAGSYEFGKGAPHLRAKAKTR